MISEEQLNKWQRLSDEATDGPWAVGKYGGGVVRVGHELRDVATRCNRDEDAAFIVASREAVPALIADVRKLNGITTRLDKEADWLAKQGSDYGCPTPDVSKMCNVTNCTLETRIKCWRQAAMDACEDSHD